MIIVGLVSSYLAGPLVQGAVRSLLPCCDAVFVYEGPAGEPLEDAGSVPATDLGLLLDGLPGRKIGYREDAWQSDAHKRTAMLRAARELRRKGESLWGVIVDDDELLFGAEWLRDWLQVLDYEEPDPARVLDDGREPYYHGRPLRLVELDGSTAWVRGRLLRLDRIAKYIVSTSVFETTDGVRYEGGGNLPESYAEWAEPRTRYFLEDRMLVRPPLPSEPYILHRSMLRHPARRPLRMHEQERSELRKAGVRVKPE